MILQYIPIKDKQMSACKCSLVIQPKPDDVSMDRPLDQQ